MENVTLRENHPTQLQIMVGKVRVGYVCYGERMPINFLPGKVMRITLTEAEKIEVAKQVRTQMLTLNAKRETTSGELSKLTGRDYEKAGASVGIGQSDSTNGSNSDATK